ncbi:gephyrin-like molybdotransferase Glp [Clostridium taeniosporum]|uniref:Molybdopterin molybdenumtransferase n=1 Tax=Clostridium taeniosporum TaxID=394958 RepID=A0A1D7XN96_9CLOT|nr:gephyrin-like molybdotransferase Glp [Clostridium taeniosporum]AOR24757.1 molybdopterin molybdenumtransferase MoeA [Clostridium taeniosporum]
MVNIDYALNVICKETKIIGTENKDLLSSVNRVLAEDIYSKDNLPPFNKSSKDGYAIKSEDTLNCSKENVCKLKVKGIIKAGDFINDTLKNGEAYKIMTGAPIPKGADAVVKIEDIEIKDDNLFIFEPINENNNIIKFGEEIKIGDLAIKKDTVIRPVEIGVLASLGYSSVKVYKAPTVALIITGDELVDINSDIKNGQIRNSNEYSLKALVTNLNAEVLSLGIVSDDRENLKEKMKYALEKADIVITSGGASVGDYDFVKDILKEIGADIKFSKIAIKPGKPVTFATFNEKLFFALPGNPSSLITTFEKFVKPTIEKIMGKDDFHSEQFKVIAMYDFECEIGREKYVYVEIKKKDGNYYAYKVGSQCSNHLMTMSRANGIIVIPKEIGHVKAGEAFNGEFIFGINFKKYIKE